MLAAYPVSCQCAMAAATMAGMTTVHIIGAGLAGLSCAVDLLRGGRRVVVYESAPHAGGRCRSFYESVLERRIDNGNHLMLGANHALMNYLDVLGARDRLISAPRVLFPYVELPTGKRWTFRPNAGRLPWWLLAPKRRVPDSRLADYFSAFRLKNSKNDGLARLAFTERNIGVPQNISDLQGLEAVRHLGQITRWAGLFVVDLNARDQIDHVAGRDRRNALPIFPGRQTLHELMKRLHPAPG